MKKHIKELEARRDALYRAFTSLSEELFAAKARLLFAERLLVKALLVEEDNRAMEAEAA